MSGQWVSHPVCLLRTKCPGCNQACDSLPILSLPVGHPSCSLGQIQLHWLLKAHRLFPPPLSWHQPSPLFALPARLQNRLCCHIHGNSVALFANVLHNLGRLVFVENSKRSRLTNSWQNPIFVWRATAFKFYDNISRALDLDNMMWMVIKRFNKQHKALMARKVVDSTYIPPKLTKNFSTYK